MFDLEMELEQNSVYFKTHHFLALNELMQKPNSYAAMAVCFESLKQATSEYEILFEYLLSGRNRI